MFAWSFCLLAAGGSRCVCRGVVRRIPDSPSMLAWKFQKDKDRRLRVAPGEAKPGEESNELLLPEPRDRV